MINYNEDFYFEYVIFKYFKVGEENSKVSIYIYDFQLKVIKEVVQIGNEWEYFLCIKWMCIFGEFCVFFMNCY